MDVLNMKTFPGKYPYSAVLNNFVNNQVKEEFPEELCFGIGEGLYFEYCSNDDKGLIFGHYDRIIESFCELMGFQSTRICLSDIDSRVIDKIKFVLENEKPIPVLLKGKTDYKKCSYLFDSRSSCIYSIVKLNSGHIVELYDPIQDEYHSYSWPDFMANGNTLPFNDKSCIPIFYLIYGRNQINNISDIIYVAIKQTARKMLNPTNNSSGLNGLENFCIDFRAKKILNQETRYFSGLSNFEKSSGLLRGFYADYLEKAASLLDKDELRELAENYRELGADWRKLLFADELGTKLSKEQLMQKILNKEKELCMKALKI